MKAICVGFVAFLGALWAAPKENWPDLEALSKIARAKMNTSVDPCVDFYNFTCGGFLQSTRIPDDRPYAGTLSNISTLRDVHLLAVLNRTDEEGDIGPFRMAKRLFRACMNEDKIEELGTKPLQQLLNRLGGWPLKDDNLSEAKNWTEIIWKFRKEGMEGGAIIDFGVMADLNNSTRRLIGIDQADTGLDQDILLDDSDQSSAIVEAYRVYIAAAMRIIDRKLAETDSRTLAAEIVDFECSLAAISASRESRRDIDSMNYHRTIAEMNEEFPYVDWLDYFQTQAGRNVEFDENEEVQILDRNFTRDLGPLLDETPRRVVHNYLLWRLVQTAIDLLHKELREEHLKFKRVAVGVTKAKPRWETCTTDIFEALPLAVSAMYVRAFFDEDSKRIADEMVERIKAEYREHLHGVQWMDAETQEAALRKLDAIRAHIGYPVELRDDAKMEKEHEGLVIDREDLFGAMLNISAFGMDLMFQEFREPINKSDWRELQAAAEVNAFYLATANHIEFSAGILQDHVFDKNHPNYMNYGGIGMVIGHEIGHAFDDQGSQFDGEGNLNNWWDNETRDKYESRAQCMIDQYASFVDPETGLELDGVNTIGENIADNEGLKQAYRAYKKVMQEREEPMLELGVDGMTREKLFWIAYGQTWCLKRTYESLKNQIKTGDHTPERFRINGPVMNIEEFSKDFGCDRGSGMNPTDRCVLW